VTRQDARKFVDRLRRYFMQEGNEGSPLSALDICADFVSEMWNVSLSFYIFLTIYMKLRINGAAA
jgi:hypothetical protein